MSLLELLPGVQSLSKIEKLQLIRLLAQELASAENGEVDSTSQADLGWSPNQAFEAAKVMMDVLRAEKDES